LQPAIDCIPAAVEQPHPLEPTDARNIHPPDGRLVPGGAGMGNKNIFFEERQIPAFSETVFLIAALVSGVREKTD